MTLTVIDFTEERVRRSMEPAMPARPTYVPNWWEQLAAWREQRDAAHKVLMRKIPRPGICAIRPTEKCAQCGADYTHLWTDGAGYRRCRTCEPRGETTR